MLSSIKPFRQINILTSLQIPVVNYKQIQKMIFDFLFDEAHTPKKKKKYKQKEEKKNLRRSQYIVVLISH